MELSLSHNANISLLSSKLRVNENFDIIERHLKVADEDVCFFYVDGFAKDAEMQRLMQYLLTQKKLTDAKELVRILPYVEVELGGSADRIPQSLRSGDSAWIHPLCQ